MEEENKHIPTSFELFGIDCGMGWFDLIKKVRAAIDEHNKGVKNDEDKIEFISIKEKWGGLSIDLNHGTRELFNLIQEVENDSYNVCEICGSRKNVGLKMNAWKKTWCHDCTVEMAKKTGTEMLWCSNDEGKRYLIYPNGIEKETKND